MNLDRFGFVQHWKWHWFGHFPKANQNARRTAQRREADKRKSTSMFNVNENDICSSRLVMENKTLIEWNARLHGFFVFVYAHHHVNFCVGANSLLFFFPFVYSLSLSVPFSISISFNLTCRSPYENSSSLSLYKNSQFSSHRNALHHASTASILTLAIHFG